MSRFDRTQHQRTRHRITQGAGIRLRAATAGWTLALLLASPSWGAQVVSLPQVLEQLEQRGLDLFYTSQLVRPTQASWPLSSREEPQQALADRLAPHGLTFEVGPMGRLFIVPMPGAMSVVRGRVVERLGQEPLGGVRILAQGTGSQTFSDAEGRFEVAGVPIGPAVVEAHEPGFVIAKTPVEVRFGEPTELLVELDIGVLALDEIVVTPSRVSLLRDDPVAGLGLEKDDLFALPHLGDDIFRALTLMPGVAGEEVSARFHVRGGRSDEVLILLDQVELYEPYHLKDYSSSVSIVSPRSLVGVDLLTGGFPAEYGDRMGGVLEMTTLDPSQTRTHLGIGLLSAEAARSGSFWEDRASWYASARRGFLDLTLDFLGQNEQPRYWDAFGKLDVRPGGSHSFGVSALTSDDTLDFDNLDPDTRERYLTGYGNSYLWGTHQSILGDRTFVEGSLSVGRVDRNRRGEEEELLDEDEGSGFSIADRRRLDVAAWKQGWHFQLSERQSWRWGAEAKRLRTSYDYFNSRQLDDPLEDIRAEPRTGTRTFVGRFTSEQLGVHVIHRGRPADRVTVETGLRYDEATLTDDREVSPRVSLVASPTPSSNLRVSWGHFFQTQRPYELQVADGVTTFGRAERTEQTVIGYEKAFSRTRGGGRGGDFLVRLEAYDRKVRNPRSRYENIFEPISIYPEIEPDRVLFAPESSHAYGAELFVQGRHERFDWWIGYTYARTLDRIDDRDVPRRIDQPHAVKMDLNLRAGRHWNVNLAWRWHTGWPTTAFDGAIALDDEGELDVEPRLGPIHGERLPNYHRLDLRASRDWALRGGSRLGFFLEVQNVYDRKNIAGFDVDLELQESTDGSVRVVKLEEPWGGILPSFGVTWDF